MTEVVDHGNDLHAVAAGQSNQMLGIRLRPLAAVPVQRRHGLVGIGAPEFQYYVGQVKESGKVQIIGFGTFASKTREARTGRNPKTGNTINIPASKTVAFKASSALKD